MPLTNNVHNGSSISDVLRALPDRFSQEALSMGELKDALSGRSYGIFLLVLALPNLIPVPAPGLSMVLGAPLILFTFQLMIGHQTPWFPHFIARRQIKREHLRHVCERIAPYLTKLELLIQPRLTILVQRPIDRIIAFICLLLSALIMMPIPFGNALPALAICLFALGILQRDGLLVILGCAVTSISITLISAFLGGIVMGIRQLLGV